MAACAREVNTLILDEQSTAARTVHAEPPSFGLRRAQASYTPPLINAVGAVSHCGTLLEETQQGPCPFPNMAAFASKAGLGGIWPHQKEVGDASVVGSQREGLETKIVGPSDKKRNVYPEKGETWLIDSGPWEEVCDADAYSSCTRGSTVSGRQT